MIGGGNTAVEEALYMTNHSHDVTLIHRRDSLRAEKILQDRLFANPKIKVLWNKAVDRFVAGGEPEGLVGLDLRDTKHRRDFARSTSKAASSPSAIRRPPSCSRASSTLDQDGYIEVEPGSTRTSVDGRVRLR